MLNRQIVFPTSGFKKRNWRPPSFVEKNHSILCSNVFFVEVKKNKTVVRIKPTFNRDRLIRTFFHHLPIHSHSQCCNCMLYTLKRHILCWIGRKKRSTGQCHLASFDTVMMNVGSSSFSLILASHG